jgi:hypothetical protein
MIRVVHPGSRIRILNFYPSRIPDLGVKKVPDPGSGSRQTFFAYPPSLSCSNAAMEIQWCKTMRMVAQVHSACNTQNVLYGRLDGKAKAGQPKISWNYYCIALYVCLIDVGGWEGGYAEVDLYIIA